MVMLNLPRVAYSVLYYSFVIFEVHVEIDQPHFFSMAIVIRTVQRFVATHESAPPLYLSDLRDFSQRFYPAAEKIELNQSESYRFASGCAKNKNNDYFSKD